MSLFPSIVQTPARVWACHFPRFILRAEQACQDHRWQVSLQAPYCPCRLHRTHCRVAATVGPLPSAPSLLAVHLSPRPPPSFPSAFRCTPTRHAWMPKAGSRLCRAPTTAIRSRVAAAPAPGAPTWKTPATAGSRAQLRAEFPRNPKVFRRSMSICLRPTTPSQDVKGRFGSSSVPSYPWTKPPAFRLPTPEIQGGRGRGEGTRVESALRRLARMRCRPCPSLA